ncbi:MAG: MOSC domain-containing protein, partial [Anaerolineae bacterium]|nr:MOSC domain-containing protein [Anaerolineae bacterium]
DVYQIGDTLRLQVSQPRQPCNQIFQALGIRGIKNKVAQTRRTGWYLRVLQEGHAEAGMSISLLQKPHPQWTITRAHEVMDARNEERKAALALSQIEVLEPGWRGRLAKAAVGI